MKAEDIIKQLYINLPDFTDLFSDQIPVSNVSILGSLVTVTTSVPHNLITGRQVTISDAKTVTPISSITRIGNLATVITSIDHDLTEGFFDNVEISGADQSDYNGTHILRSVPNRRTFSFVVSNNPATPATGSNIALLNGGVVNFNDRYTINVLNSTQFTFSIIGNTNIAPINLKIHSNIRISGAVSVERAIESYTKQNANNLWAFVVLDDSLVSKDRQIFSDAITTRANCVDFRLRLLKNFSVYIVIPSTQSISGRQQRDLIEDIEPYLYRSILGLKLSGPFTEDTWSMVVPVGNGFYDYVGSYYVHRFQFQTSYDLLYEDTAINPKTRAFRDIRLDYLDEEKELLIRTDVNLDDVPL